jgi:hypothetical protein
LDVFESLPKKGVLEFDFISSRRPPPLGPSQQPVAVKARRLFAILESCVLMAPEDRIEALDYLNKTREDCNLTYRGR